MLCLSRALKVPPQSEFSGSVFAPGLSLLHFPYLLPGWALLCPFSSFLENLGALFGGKMPNVYKEILGGTYMFHVWNGEELVSAPSLRNEKKYQKYFSVMSKF